MSTAWRIVKKELAARAFDGEGARVNGGRWNSVGTPVVYLATTQALAVLEILVHLHDPDTLRSGWVIFEVTYADRHRRDVDAAALPAGWRKAPPPATVQAVGDRWCARRSSVLLGVPSAILPAETNLLVNPLHPAFGELSIRGPQPLPIDPRLIARR